MNRCITKAGLRCLNGASRCQGRDIIQPFRSDILDMAFSVARENLFLHWWPRLIGGERPAGEPQSAGGSYHARAELIELRDAADVGAMSAADLIRLTRALAMPGMPGLRVGPSHRLVYVEE